jgi:hypothetical protein
MNVAVTGHRDIDEHDPVLIEAVANQLAHLRSPGGTLTLLSCLAEGADRLVARVALSRFGVALVAVLPMGVEQYEEDFGNEQSCREFRRLLRRAHEVVRIPGSVETGGDRGGQYARAGAYLLVHAETLLALWDGRPPRGVGGTAMIVDWARKGRVPEEYAVGIGQPANPRRVIHIQVPSGQVRAT